MNQPFQILLDIWEGNPDLDVPTLKAAGVVGLIVRINDMNGGHHKDERFEQNWATAKLFDTQTIYFVYNPWKTGRENYDWLMANLPPDYGKRRLMVDTEVKKPDYSPNVYADELDIFHALIAQVFPDAIYTGAWFMPLVSHWPKTCPYWWAAYPTALQGHKTWEAYKAALATVSFAGFTASAPGEARLWQCSGDGVILPGFGAHAVDVNVFPGTLEDLKTWLNISEEEQEPMTEPNIWTTYEIGCEIPWNAQPTVDELKALKDRGVSFVVTKAGGVDPANAKDWGWLNPNQDKQIQNAYDAGMPAFSRYNPVPAAPGYTQTSMINDQLTYAKEAIRNNKIYGYIVNGLMYTDTEGNTATNGNITGVTKGIADGLSTALDDQNIVVMVRTNDTFCQDNAPDYIPVAKLHPCYLADPRYRKPDNSQVAIPASATITTPAELRAHLNTLPEGWNNPYVPDGDHTELLFWDIGVYGGVRWIIFKGNAETFKTRFGITGTAPVEPPPPPPPPPVVTDLQPVMDELFALRGQVTAIQDKLNRRLPD